MAIMTLGIKTLGIRIDEDDEIPEIIIRLNRKHAGTITATVPCFSGPRYNIFRANQG